jgi:hypothetical protein
MLTSPSPLSIHAAKPSRTGQQLLVEYASLTGRTVHDAASQLVEMYRFDANEFKLAIGSEFGFNRVELLELITTATNVSRQA